MRKFTSWQPIIEKIQQRLATWKASCLTRPGKLVLIKAVLSSLPVYYLSLFRMPKRVAHEINKIQRRFLWSGKNESKASALVKWEVVQRTKKEGGLGVGDPLLKNAALLFKWWWRFACEEGAMWKLVVQSIHEEDQLLLPTKNVSTLPGPWRDIKRIAIEESSVSKAFFENIAIRIGDGRKVRFWLDAWINEKTLKAEFPELFRQSAQQCELVSNMGWYEGPMWRWTLTWKSELTPEQQAQVITLQGILQHHHPRHNAKDQLRWGNKSNFCTKGLMTEVGKVNQRNVIVDNLASTVWMKVAPPKVEFMTWLALLGKLNTREMLVRKGILNSEDNKCSFCQSNPETLDHLLLSCAVSRNVWNNIAADIGVRLEEEQQCFRRFYEWWMTRYHPNKLRKKLCILSFFATTWSLWTKRNMIVFQNEDFEHQTLCHIIKWRIALWSKAWKDTIPYSVEELVRNFHTIPRLFP